MRNLATTIARRILLTLTAAAFSVIPAQAALVQGDCLNGNLFATTPTYVYTYPAPITTGNLVVMGFNSGNPRSFVSAAGGATTYAVAGSDSTSGIGRSWIISAIAAGADTTVTITLSGNEGNSLTLCFAEFSAAAADQSGATHNGSVNSATTSHNSGSVTPPTATNIVVSYIAHTSGSWTYDTTDWTRIDAAGSANGWMGYILQTAATAQEANHSAADNETSSIRITAFAAIGGAGPPQQNRMLIRGGTVP